MVHIYGLYKAISKKALLCNTLSNRFNEVGKSYSSGNLFVNHFNNLLIYSVFFNNNFILIGKCMCVGFY